MYDAVHKLSQQIDELERVMFSITGAPSINQVEFLRFMSSLSNEDHRELGLLSAREKISFLVRRTINLHPRVGRGDMRPPFRGRIPQVDMPRSRNAAV